VEVLRRFGRHSAGDVPDARYVIFPRWYREHGAKICCRRDWQGVVRETQSQIIGLEPVEVGTAEGRSLVKFLDNLLRSTHPSSRILPSMTGTALITPCEDIVRDGM
jgi:hypothetical protein